MRFYEYKCDCGRVKEDTNPSPPLCPSCKVLMKRVFTPSYISVKGGTPRFYRTTHDIPKQKEREQGIAEYETETKELRQGMKERKKNDEAAFRRYCEGELHHKHGTPDEASTYDPGKNYEGQI